MTLFPGDIQIQLVFKVDDVEKSTAPLTNDLFVVLLQKSVDNRGLKKNERITKSNKGS
jgi:hypothetical protein